MRPVPFQAARWFLPVLFGLVLLGLVWTPFEPSAEPGWPHLLGSDALGRDFFSRLWRGAANTLAMAAAAGALTFLGSALLLVLERRGGALARMLAAGAVAVWMGLPVLLTGLLLLLFLPAGPETLVLAAGLGSIPFAYRQLRILWLEQCAAPHVEASQVLGAGPARLLCHTLWPNLRPDIAALARVLFALAALELSGLAYLGLIGDPDFPELGAMLRQNQQELFLRPALALLPGGLLSGLLLLVHLSGGNRER